MRLIAVYEQIVNTCVQAGVFLFLTHTVEGELLDQIAFCLVYAHATNAIFLRGPLLHSLAFNHRSRVEFFSFLFICLLIFTVIALYTYPLRRIPELFLLLLSILVFETVRKINITRGEPTLVVKIQSVRLLLFLLFVSAYNFYMANLQYATYASLIYFAIFCLPAALIFMLSKAPSGLKTGNSTINVNVYVNAILITIGTSGFYLAGRVLNNQFPMAELRYAQLFLGPMGAYMQFYELQHAKSVRTRENINNVRHLLMLILLICACSAVLSGALLFTPVSSDLNRDSIMRVYCFLSLFCFIDFRILHLMYSLDFKRTTKIYIIAICTGAIPLVTGTGVDAIFIAVLTTKLTIILLEKTKWLK